MVKRLITIFILSGLFFSCRPERIKKEHNEVGAVTRQPYHWRSSITDGPRGSNLLKGYVVDGKGVLYFGRRNTGNPQILWQSYLGLKDFETGKDIWVWDELFDKRLEQVLDHHLLIRNNQISVHDWRSDYLIDGEKGTTLWKKRRDYSSASTITGVDDQVYMSAMSRDHPQTNKQEDYV